MSTEFKMFKYVAKDIYCGGLYTHIYTHDLANKCYFETIVFFWGVISFNFNRKNLGESKTS